MIEVLKNFVMPSQFATAVILAGMALIVFRRFRQTGARLVAAGSLILLVFSSGFTASVLMSPLEYRYPPLVDLQDYAHIDTAVVLTAFATDDRNMPLSSRGGSSTVYRVLEASRLFREGNVEAILVSGDPVAAPIMRDLLISVGVPAKKIEHDADSHHTVESAVNLVSSLEGREFFLVTSAGHMPRAMGVFRKVGLDPIAAPTDFQLPQNALSASIYPSPFHLFVSDLAVREYLGLLWYRISGKTAVYW